jgi:hypothetical protein
MGFDGKISKAVRIPNLDANHLLAADVRGRVFDPAAILNSRSMLPEREPQPRWELPVHLHAGRGGRSYFDNHETPGLKSFLPEYRKLKAIEYYKGWKKKTRGWQWVYRAPAGYLKTILW